MNGSNRDVLSIKPNKTIIVSKDQKRIIIRISFGEIRERRERREEKRRKKESEEETLEEESSRVKGGESMLLFDCVFWVMIINMLGCSISIFRIFECQGLKGNYVFQLRMMTHDQ